jgi:hypothetical protein
MKPLPLFRATVLRILLLAPVFVPPATAHGAPADEIARLLLFIERSGCTFIRNGKEPTAGRFLPRPFHRR